MNNPHHIEVTLTEEDYLALPYFISSRMKSTRNAIRQTQIGVAIVFFCFFAWSLWRNHQNNVSVEKIIFNFSLAVLIMLVTILYLGWSLRCSMRKNIRKSVRELQGNLFGKTEIMELRDDGVHNQCAIGQSLFPYSAMGEIAEDKNHVYVFIGKDRALILPRGRIPADTLDAFLSELKTRVARTKETKKDILHD